MDGAQCTSGEEVSYVWDREDPYTTLCITQGSNFIPINYAGSLTADLIQTVHFGSNMAEGLEKVTIGENDTMYQTQKLGSIV